MPDLCQPELTLRQRAARAVTKDSVEELCQLLRGRTGMTAAALMKLRPEWNERFIRLLANASGRRVISFPGSPGYRLADDLHTAVEIEEIDHAGKSMISQGREMTERGIAFLQLAALKRKALS